MIKNNLLSLLLAVVLFTGLSMQSFAQPSQGGTPPSFTTGLDNDIDVLMLTAPNMDYLTKQDQTDEKNGTFYRVGISVPVNASMENSGTWSSLPDGRQVWRLKIAAPGAHATAVYYKEFFLPKGSQLFLYNEDKNHVIGAYTHENNPVSNFSTEMIQGETVTLEYVSPSNSTTGRSLFVKPVINVSEISYIYRGVESRFAYLTKSTGWGQSESCHVNVICSPEGTNWQDEKRGVVEIFLTAGGSQGWCTGSLVNNTNQNCTPYVLSAYHCYAGATTAELNAWQFYFNYQSAACATPAFQPSYSTITGCTLKATGPQSGGSDMFLCQLNSNVSSSINPYYNGWNRNTAASTGGVGIHHPMGDIKKISTFTGTTVSATWSGGASGAHWRLNWVATTNGHGVTEGGSSGSPIFDNNGRIIGTLTGGSSYCTSPTSPDLYGKFSYHWQSNGTTDNKRLLPWLDPTGSGVTTLDGRYSCTAAAPVADFSGTPTTVSVGGQVTFTDLSTNAPTSWSWSFAGGTPATSTLQNPVITYNTVGVYNVQLIATNTNGSNTKLKTGYITVSTGPSVCDSLNYPLAGTEVIYTNSSCPTGVTTAPGYVAGKNCFGDKVKANYYATYAPYTKIDGAYFKFGVAKGTGTTNITFNIYNNSGTGGAPGTSIGSKTVLLSQIISDVTGGLLTWVDFTGLVTIPGPFYIGVTIPTATSDSIALFTNTNGDTNPGIGWEQFSDNSWVAYSTTPGSWGINVANAIYPVVCPNSTSIEIGETSGVKIFPNPSSGSVFVDLGEYSFDETNVSVYTMFGQLVESYSKNELSKHQMTLELGTLANGVYIIHVDSPKGKVIQKISIVK